jgi:hypothetical protein
VARSTISKRMNNVIYLTYVLCFRAQRHNFIECTPYLLGAVASRSCTICIHIDWVCHTSTRCLSFANHLFLPFVLVVFRGTRQKFDEACKAVRQC